MEVSNFFGFYFRRGSVGFELTDGAGERREVLGVGETFENLEHGLVDLRKLIEAFEVLEQFLHQNNIGQFPLRLSYHAAPNVTYAVFRKEIFLPDDIFDLMFIFLQGTVVEQRIVQLPPPLQKMTYKLNCPVN